MRSASKQAVVNKREALRLSEVFCKKCENEIDLSQNLTIVHPYKRAR